MRHIDSRHNSLFKTLVRLADGKRLTSAASVGLPDQAILLDGVHLCQEWLRHKGEPLYALFHADHLAHSASLQQLASQVAGNRCFTLEPTLLGRLSNIAADQGVLFVAGRPVATRPASIDQSCLWLDRVQDPGNVGTLLRTAAAAGLAAVYLSKGCARAWSSTVLRAAQGAHFALDIHEQVPLHSLTGSLRIPLMAMGLDTSAVSLYAVPLKQPCVWVAGNEGQGVDPDLLRAADYIVRIPQSLAAESLNISVATGICLFEQRRRQLGK